MKQIQRDIQDTKISIESWQNHLYEAEDRLSELEERMEDYDHERKSLLKITRKQQFNSCKVMQRDTI